MTLTINKKVLIVGLGLIGGSYARGLTEKGYFVGAIDTNGESIDYALKNGIIKEGSTEVKEEFVSKYDLIIFCLYPLVFLDWIKNNQDKIKKNAIITDVTGVKCSVVYEVQSRLRKSRKDIEFIPHHPMAGKEVYGVKNSDAGIFRGANFIITPTSENSSEGIEVIKELGNVLGFRKVSILTPAEHDEMIGFLSQLTHLIAVSLMTSKESKHLVDFTGDSFRDLTRIAKINEDMWTELFLMNKNELLGQMDLFIGQIKKMRDALAIDDIETMKEMMKLSTERRKYFDEK